MNGQDHWRVIEVREQMCMAHTFVNVNHTYRLPTCQVVGGAGSTKKLLVTGMPRHSAPAQSVRIYPLKPGEQTHGWIRRNRLRNRLLEL